MHININGLSKVLTEIVQRECAPVNKNLTEIEFSALTSWVEDCYQSFNNIYEEFLVSLANAKANEDELIHDNIVDIYWELQHIKNHIIDSEKGFSELMKLLATKIEKSERNDG